MSSIITATFQIISFFCSSGNLASSLTGFLQKYCVWKIWVFHRVVDSTETSTLCGAAFCWLLTFAVLDKPEKRTLSTQSAKSVWKFSKTWNHKFHIVVTSGLTNLTAWLKFGKVKPTISAPAALQSVSTVSVLFSSLRCLCVFVCV